MKQCKIIRINEGNPAEFMNEDFLHVEELPRSEQILNGFLNEGWTLVHMMPQYTPNINHEGAYSFFRSGYTYYLERETDESVPTKKFPETVDEHLESLLSDFVPLEEDDESDYDDYDDYFDDDYPDE